MIRTYDTGAGEEKALAYIAALPRLPNAPIETADDAFARLVKSVLRGPVQLMRAAKDEQRAVAYDAATAQAKAAVDAALGIT